MARSPDSTNLSSWNPLAAGELDDNKEKEVQGSNHQDVKEDEVNYGGVPNVHVESDGPDSCLESCISEITEENLDSHSSLESHSDDHSQKQLKRQDKIEEKKKRKKEEHK